MAIGNRGTYATLQAPNDPLLDTLQNIEQVGFQKRAEDRLIAQKKKDEEDKRLAEDVAWDGKFDPTIVGNSKIDDPMLSMAFKAKEQVGQIRRELRNPNLSYDEKVRLNSKLNRISQSFDVANQTPKIILDKAKEIAKNIDKYDPDSVNLIEGIAKQLETGKYEAYYDDNGTARVRIYNTDESGKPIGVLKETTIAELANEFQPRQKSKYTDLLEDAVKNTAVSDITTQKGARILQTKGVNPEIAEAKADALARLIMSNPDEVYAAAKRFQIDQNDTNAIYEAVKNDYKNSLDRLVKEDIDSALLTEGRQARKQAKEEAEKEIIIGKPTVIKDEGKYASGIKVQKGTKSHPLGNVIIDSGQGKKQKATNVYVSPGGKMYLRVEETGFEGKSENQKVPNESGLRKLNSINPRTKKKYTEDELFAEDFKTVTISDKKPVVKMLDFGKDGPEIGRFALKMGYKGYDDLKNDFIERSGGDEFIVTPDERKQKKYSTRQEQAIQAAIKANPGYSREEIIKALGL